MSVIVHGGEHIGRSDARALLRCQSTRLVEDRANTYGALGIAAALLLSLAVVGRLIVVSAELNASLAAHRARQAPNSSPKANWSGGSIERRRLGKTAEGLLGQLRGLCAAGCASVRE
jgi:hypothetical protein